MSGKKGNKTKARLNKAMEGDMEEPIEGFYQMRGKEIVDMLFNKGYFNEDVSRDGMKDVEDFIAWMIQAQCESAVKCALLVKRVKEVR